MGAFGVVTASRHVELGQMVAIKKIEKEEVRKRKPASAPSIKK